MLSVVCINSWEPSCFSRARCHHMYCSLQLCDLLHLVLPSSLVESGTVTCQAVKCLAILGQAGCDHHTAVQVFFVRSVKLGVTAGHGQLAYTILLRSIAQPSRSWGSASMIILDPERCMIDVCVMQLQLTSWLPSTM